MNLHRLKWNQGYGLSLLRCIILTTLVALGLYFCNNQSTYQDISATQGVWHGAETDLSQEVHFLDQDWLYYYDVLLTPDTLSTANQAESTVVTIGEHTSLAFGSTQHSPYGMGSYVMTLELPPTPALYAITIPIVYSAYNLYIGDTLYTTVGDPSPDTYTTKAQVKTVLFQGSGTTPVILAVSNTNFYYGGLTSAPILGSPALVTSIAYTSLVASAVFTTLTLVLCAVGTWLSLTKSTNLASPWLIFLLFLCASLMVCDLAVGLLLSLPRLHWYRFIQINSWLLTLLIILLHNIISKPPRPLAWFATGFTLLMTLLCGITMCFPTLMPQNSHRLDAPVRFVALCIIVLCLVAISYHGLKQDPQKLSVLFYSDISYAILLFWDARLTDFQPIIGWKFKEIGELIVVFTLAYALCREILKRHDERVALEVDHRHMTHQLSIQQTHFDEISNQIAESRRQRHDFRHHLHTISNLIDQPQALRDYIGGIVDIADQATPVRYCHIPALNALLFHYTTIAKKAEIPLHIKVELPEDIALPAVSYCVILGNLLENAFTACQMDSTERPYIDLHIKWQYEKIYTLLDNRFDGILTKKGGAILSRKHKGPGQGLSSVTTMAQQLHGTAEFQIADNRFRSIVILPPETLS